jgi:DNA polymerase-3 subunit chi
MTRIDFYVLATADTRSRCVMACRLVEKAYQQGHRVYLRTASLEEAELLDDLLWTFRQGSFVPHELASTVEMDDEPPVLIGHTDPPSFMSDVLINLAAGVPSGFEGFERLAEIIDQDENRRHAGRVRYKDYKDAGFLPETHQL